MKKTLFSVLLTLSYCFLGAVENSTGVDIELVTTKGNYDITRDIFNRIPSDGTLKRLIFSSPFFGKNTANRLATIQKSNPNAKIEVICGSAGAKYMQILQKAGIEVTKRKSLHDKAMVWKTIETYGEVEEHSDYDGPNTITETRAAHGSFNFGETSKFNHESMIISSDRRVYKEIKRILMDHKNATTPKKDDAKIVIEQTPKKFATFSSFDVDFNQSRRKRIESLANAKNEKPTDRLVITSMTFNDEDLASTLKDVIKTRKYDLDCEIFFNKDALNHPGLLKQLIALKGVRVYIRKPESIFENSPIQKIQHTKYFLRKANDKWTMITSSANWTDEGNAQRNGESYIPNPDETLIKETLDYIETYIKPVSDQLTDDILTQKVKEFAAKKQASKEKAREKQKRKREEQKQESTSSESSLKKPRKRLKKQLSFTD